MIRLLHTEFLPGWDYLNNMFVHILNYVYKYSHLEYSFIYPLTL